MEDVTHLAHLGPTRQGQPLTGAEQQRLRELTGKANATPQEQYERGALVGRARGSQAGQWFLRDLAHDRIAARAAGGGRRRGVTQGQAKTLSEALAGAVQRVLDDLDEDDRYQRLGW
jgi:hypothetical protein